MISFPQLTRPLYSIILPASGQARRGSAFQTPPGSKDSNGKKVSLGAAGALPGYLWAALSTSTHIWENNHMPRWAFSLIAIVVGIGLGLLYGWVINPVKFIDTTPESLRADYRADYVLMIAEAFHAEQNADLAVHQLAALGSGSPAQIAAQALQTAGKIGYSVNDISLLQELTRAMQAYQPAPAPPGGVP
jgi:hypothetical protein